MAMEKEVLIEFYKEVFDGINLMNRRQRWQLRRDMKEYCRLVNVRYPYGKTEDLNVSDDSGNSGGVLSTAPAEGSSNVCRADENNGQPDGGAQGIPNYATHPAEISNGQTSAVGEIEEEGC